MEHVPPAERTLPALLERQAEALGDLPFLQVGELRRSFAEMRDAVARLAGSFRAAGIVAGDRVAIMAENRPEIVDAWFAASWLGAILVPFNTATRGPQLAHVIVDSGPRVFAVDPELLPQLDAVELLPPELERIWLLGVDGESTYRGLPVSRFPGPGEPVAAEPVRPGDTDRDPLHLGHHRPLEGCLLPARPVLLVGAQHRGRCSAASPPRTSSTPRCRSSTPTR